MDGEHSNSSAVTVSYEDYCLANDLPLGLMMDKQEPGTSGEYSFVNCSVLVPRW